MRAKRRDGREAPAIVARTRSDAAMSAGATWQYAGPLPGHALVVLDSECW